MSETFKPGPDDVQILRREQCFSGFYRLERVHLRHRQFSGAMGAELSRELFVRHDAVCVLPYDPLRDRVVLIEQFRVGALGKVDNPWLIELVAGLIDRTRRRIKSPVARRWKRPGWSWASCGRSRVIFHRRAAATSAYTSI